MALLGGRDRSSSWHRREVGQLLGWPPELGGVEVTEQDAGVVDDLGVGGDLDRDVAEEGPAFG